VFSKDSANRLGLMRFNGKLAKVPAYFKMIAQPLPVTPFVPADGDGYLEISDIPDAAAIGYSGSLTSTIAGVTYDVGELNSLGYPFKLLLVTYDKDGDGLYLVNKPIYMSIVCNIANKISENISILLKHDANLDANEFTIIKGNKITALITNDDLPSTPAGYQDLHTNFVVKFNKTLTTTNELAAALNDIEVNSSLNYFTCDFSYNTDAFLNNTVDDTLLASGLNEYTIQLERTSQHFSFNNGFKAFYDTYLYNAPRAFALLAYENNVNGIPQFLHTGVLGFYANANYTTPAETDGLEYDPIFSNTRNIAIHTVANPPIGFISDTRSPDVDHTTFNETINSRFFTVDQANYQHDAIQYNFYPFMIIEPSCVKFMNGLTVKLADIIKFGAAGANMDASASSSELVLESNVLFDLHTLEAAATEVPYKKTLARYKDAMLREAGTGTVPDDIPTSLSAGGSALRVISDILSQDLDFGRGLLDGDYLVVDDGYAAYLTDLTLNPGTNRFSSLHNALIASYHNTAQSTIIIRYNISTTTTIYELDMEELITEYLTKASLEVISDTTIASLFNNINFIFWGFPDAVTPTIVLQMNSGSTFNYSLYDYFAFRFHNCTFSRFNSSTLVYEASVNKNIGITFDGNRIVDGSGPNYHLKLLLRGCATPNSSLVILADDFATGDKPHNQAWIELNQNDSTSISIYSITGGWDVAVLNSSMNCDVLGCNHCEILLANMDITINRLSAFNVTGHNVSNSKIKINTLYITENTTSKTTLPGNWVGEYPGVTPPEWSGDYGRSYLTLSNVSNSLITINLFDVTHSATMVAPYGDPDLATVTLMSVIGFKEIFKNSSLTVNDFATHSITYDALEGLKVIKVWTASPAVENLVGNHITLKGLNSLITNGTDNYTVFANTGSEYFTEYSALLDFYGGTDFLNDLATASDDVELLRTKFMRDSIIDIIDTNIMFYNTELLSPAGWTGIDFADLDPTDPADYQTLVTLLNTWYSGAHTHPAAFIFGLMNCNLNITGRVHCVSEYPFGVDKDPTDTLWGKPVALLAGLWKCDVNVDEALFGSGDTFFDSIDDYVDYYISTPTAAVLEDVMASLYSSLMPTTAVFESNITINHMFSTSNNLAFSWCSGMDFKSCNTQSLAFPNIPLHYTTMMVGLVGCTFKMISPNPLLCQKLLLTDFGTAAVNGVQINEATFADFSIAPYIDSPLALYPNMHKSSTVSNVIARGCKFTFMPSITGMLESNKGKGCSFHGEISANAALYPMGVNIGSNVYADMNLENYVAP